MCVNLRSLCIILRCLVCMRIWGRSIYSCNIGKDCYMHLCRIKLIASDTLWTKWVIGNYGTKQYLLIYCTWMVEFIYICIWNLEYGARIWLDGWSLFKNLEWICGSRFPISHSFCETSGISWLRSDSIECSTRIPVRLHKTAYHCAPSRVIVRPRMPSDIDIYRWSGKIPSDGGCVRKVRKE